MKLTLKELAQLTGGRLEGDSGAVVTNAAGLKDAGPGDVSFLSDLKLKAEAAATQAACVIVPEDFRGDCPAARLSVKNPQLAFIKVLTLLEKERRSDPKGIHPSAVIHPSAMLEAGVGVGALCVIEEGARVGAGTVLYPQTYVGAGTVIGRDCVLYPHAVVRERCELGDRVVVHSGVSIGADGFGFAQDGGVHHKIPQVGRVVIESDVEVGANSCIDRAMLGETRIGAGTKIDNLVQLAHNVRVGKGCLIISQVGVSGSTTLGDYVILAGQAGLIGHIKIGARAVVMAQAGIMRDLPEGAVVWGSPSRPYRDMMKQISLNSRLPEIFEDVRDLKKAAAKTPEAA